MRKPKPKGKYRYMLLLPPEDPIKCHHDAINMPNFDSDEAAVFYAIDHFKICSNTFVVRVVGAPDTSLNLVRYEK